MNENHSQKAWWATGPLVALLIGLFLLPYAGWAKTTAGSTWKSRVPLIEQKLQESLKVYESGDIKNAKRLCDDAYFELFEDIEANMEVAVRRFISLGQASALESAFGDIRKAYSKKLATNDVEAQIKKLVSGLHESAQNLDAKKISLKL